jgi:hypothetical protein
MVLTMKSVRQQLFNAVAALSFALFLATLMMLVTGYEPRYLAQIGLGGRYYDADQFAGSLYFSSTLDKDRSLGTSDALNPPFFVGLRKSSPFWQTVTLGVPYWPFGLIGGIVLVWREKNLLATQAPSGRLRLKLFAAGFALVACIAWSLAAQYNNF